MKLPEGTAAIGERLSAIYRDVDRVSRSLRTIHAGRIRCAPGCASCCVDGITIFEVEAMLIRAKNRDLLLRETPHAAGACAFLDSRDCCRIYADRPYVCRTQGLPLRWLEEDGRGGIVEMRDICPLNNEGIPLQELPEDACWTIGPAEGQLAAAQSGFRGRKMRRVALRDLFERSPECRNGS